MRCCIASLTLAGTALALVSEAQEVTLPLDRYEALRAQASAAQEPPAAPKPPAPFALEAAAVEVHVGADSARVTQRLTLSLYAADWQVVQIAAAGSLTAAQLGTLEGRVQAEPLALVVRGRGRHEVRIDSVVPLAVDATSARPTRLLRVDLPAAAAVTGSVHALDDVEEVVFSAGGVVRATTGRRWDFAGAPGRALELTLLGKARAPLKARLPLKMKTVSTTLATLGRTRLAVRASVSVRVQQGQLDQLRLAVPQGLDVVSVSAPGAAWDVDGAALVVTPPAPVEDSWSLTVDLAGEPRDALPAPLLVPQGDPAPVLLAALKVEADGFPEVVDAGSGRRPEDEELLAVPDELKPAGVRLLLVRDAAHPPSWAVTWPQKSQVLGAQVDRLLVDVVAGRAGRAAYQCWAVVRSSGQTRLALRMPAGFEPIAAERDGVAVTPGVSEEGLLLVPLAASSDPQAVHVSGLLRQEVPAEGKLELPVPAASAPVASVELRAGLPGDRTYTLEAAERAHSFEAVPAARARQKGAASGLGTLARPAAARLRASEPFRIPAGYARVEARWSALSPAPGPLVLRVKPMRAKEEWF